MMEKGYKVTGKLVIAAVVSSLGGLLFGFDTAVIAGTTSSVKSLYQLSDWSIGFVVSSALLGTVLGAAISSRPGDIWGRRNYLKLLGALFLVSALGCSIAWDFWSLTIARFVGGIGVGGASVMGPMYIAEISPAKIRGRLVILFQFNVCLGILLAYLSNAIIQHIAFDFNLEWRIMFAAEAIPAILFISMLFTIPRSPRWLMLKNDINAARSVLAQMGELKIDEAISEIQSSLKKRISTKSERLFQKKYLYPIFLGVSVAAFNQLSFVNGYLYYLNDTLTEIGASFGGKFQPVIIGVANVIAVTTALLTIDRIGRKKLLLIGSWGAALPLAVCGYIAWTREFIEFFPWSIALFILFFSFSQGAVIWVYISEVFPNMVRNKGQALGSFTHWSLCAIAAFVYPVVVGSSAIGLAFPFLFGSVMMVLQFFVVWFFFVETNGIPLEQLERQLKVN